MYNNQLFHYGIKGMKWGVRRSDAQLARARKEKLREINEKQRKQEQKSSARRMNALTNSGAHATVTSAKRAAGSAAVALGSAAIGSAATYALAKKGKPEAAKAIYILSKSAFDASAQTAKINAGVAVLSSLVTSKESMSRYLNEEKRIKEKYR